MGWTQAESTVDKGAPGKLWDGSPWHRPVMDKTRAFTIPRPWYSILAAGHIPKTFAATSKDVFGLRQRLTVCVPTPSWKKLDEIDTACQQLPVAPHEPADFLAALCYPVLNYSLKFPCS